MADLTGMLQAAAGSAGGAGPTIQEVFNTTLYTGTGSTQTITNGIDLDGNGGLIWTKRRETDQNNALVQAPSNIYLVSNSNGADAPFAYLSFNTDGYDIDQGFANWNASGGSYVSWTFRNAPKFFDVVTYTGTGSARTVSHNLGSVPGCIIVKRTDTTGDWQVYHRANTANPETDYLVLNSTAATVDSNTRWNDTAPTDSVFTVGTEATVNASGGTYIAYLFAHDAGGFGDGGAQNVISCGAGVNNVAVDLGYEPQFVILKRTDATGPWYIMDTARGFPTSGSSTALLQAQASDAEFNTGAFLRTSTGFISTAGITNFIYIAIRADM